MIKRPLSTFLVRVKGDSMLRAGIHDGDLLIVDRSITPVSGKIVIAVINGECLVKRIMFKNNRLLLLSENDEYAPIEVRQVSDSLFIWGWSLVPLTFPSIYQAPWNSLWVSPKEWKVRKD